MIIAAIVSLAAALGTVQVPVNLVMAKPSPDTVMAKVNGVAIKAGDVDKLLWDWHSAEVAQDLITYQLIHSEADRLKVSPMPGEVMKAFNSYLDQQKKNLPAGQDFDTALRQQGLPKSRLFMQFEGNMLLTKIVDASFNPKAFYKVSTLLFSAKSEAAADIQDAAGKAQDAYKRLSSGEDWDKVLTSSGQDQRLIQNKGELGWVSFDNFPPMTQKELETLKPGGYSKAVSTKNGIQIFRLEALGSTASGAELAAMKTRYEQTAKGTLIQNIQKSAKVEKFFISPTHP